MNCGIYMMDIGRSGSIQSQLEIHLIPACYNVIRKQAVRRQDLKVGGAIGSVPLVPKTIGGVHLYSLLNISQMLVGHFAAESCSNYRPGKSRCAHRNRMPKIIERLI